MYVVPARSLCATHGSGCRTAAAERTSVTRLPRRIAAGTFIAAAIAVPLSIGIAAPGSAAPATPCVGLIVDDSQDPPMRACVPYTAGMTGTAVLAKAHIGTAKAANGLVCQIDGFPKACTKGDNTHYWSYYIRKPDGPPGAWDYASKGPDDQKAVAGETEAWVYLNGADRKPPATPYAQLAAATGGTPTASPASTLTSSAGTSSAPSSGASAKQSTSAKRPSSTSPSAASSSAGSSSAASSSATTASSAPAASASKDDGGSNTAWWIALPIAVVVIAGGVVLARRRRA